ncbi:MAG: hypothetical protein ABIP07_02320 [Sphingomicrobium sp.]
MSTNTVNPSPIASGSSSATGRRITPFRSSRWIRRQHGLTIGGGMGRSENDPTTFPRLADVIGFIPRHRVCAATEAVMSVQRDYGNRLERHHARFKYTVHDKGVDWVKREIETRLDEPLGKARPFHFTSNGDRFGWNQTDSGRFDCTLFIPSGRIINTSDQAWMNGLRKIAEVHRGTLRMTPNQNLIIADAAPADRAEIERLLAEHGLAASEAKSAIRLNSIACVALPTCGLAMAEAERYMPEILTRIEALLSGHGLIDEPITFRISGCPNGCSRPYVAEIALSGRAPGKYNLYLGGGFHGERLNRMVRENISEDAILILLGNLFARYARERNSGERLGDFVTRGDFS